VETGWPGSPDAAKAEMTSDQAMSREEALLRYRTCRQAIRRHLNAAIKYTSADAIKVTARRIGLLSEGAIAADSFAEMTLVFDLVVFGTKTERSRAIDRYARANRFPDGSVEAAVLTALQAGTFRIIQVKGRHHIAGIVVEDMFGGQEMWVMDEGFEATLTDGMMLAARLIRLDPFHSTAGASVPISRYILQEALLSLAGRRSVNPALLDNPRLPEAVYAAAIKNGAMDTISFEGEDQD
jgi:hypothetical protein